MSLPLVVGVDGSEASLRAVDWAAEEAAMRGLELRLLHASLWEPYEGTGPNVPLNRPHGLDIAAQILQGAIARAAARHREVKIFAETLAEEPEPVLMRAALNATALVTGRRGRGPVQELLLGSVSLAVAAHAPCPVIVVRGSEAGRNAIHERILLGVGDADSSVSAIRFAFAEAATRHCVLDAVRAWRSPVREPLHHPPQPGESACPDQLRAQELLADSLRGPARVHPDVRMRPVAVEGPARRILIDRSAAADLLVVGTRRRHSHFGLQLGPVGHALLHHADCPVAIVPQHGS
ncbi:universal stress protein [Streptomyces longispororuber]|uniref:universal stress protein n=1 Tax=Streptomyces longispororuber TaxID=68230 RepID=UPI002108F1AD|nr:universal stress protein [Streptomyces longispororuber]MCQ4205659.1 universal stress protein [Streptomyces longispororuber]